MNAARPFSESDIVHERGRFFVLRERKPGRFTVLRNDSTHSVVRGTFSFPSRPDYALERAIDDCNRRAAGDGLQRALERVSR